MKKAYKIYESKQNNYTTKNHGKKEQMLTVEK